jgi:hypothetical protein
MKNVTAKLSVIATFSKDILDNGFPLVAGWHELCTASKEEPI